ncbi:MAG TPA: O-antigen ligase family protein [Patescibacteria group bacterium]|nr:O-antigen ligase family protein [Patescibacteria group bacterium]
MKLLKISNRIIEFSFYSLFFFVPLVFWNSTSELFELNKMWLTFILTILIVAAWIIKSIVTRKFFVQRTPLDIPIALFFISQVISTIFSWDPYVSIWGYYSRFNGGLLSIICYIALYYAFLSNFPLKKIGNELDLQTMVKRIIWISLGSAAIVALWGLPSHFGYDPTCLLFRGSFDVSCWTADFQPKIRIFSTLGQPAWLGAYLAILAPLLFAFLKEKDRSIKSKALLLLGIVIFYVDILFTRARAAIIAFWLSLLLFAFAYYWTDLRKRIKKISFKSLYPYAKNSSLIFVGLLIVTFLALNPLNLSISKGKIQTEKPKTAQLQSGSFSSGGGGTESGKIRLLVWQGALNTWIHYPVFGTGVETFAFAYYKFRPVEHNLTSEWNYLYNKAHNEYLNYLATTGIVGLLTYLSMIGLFLFFVGKYFKDRKFSPIPTALIAGYVSMLVSNFFGFSVVITNLYLFLIPAFVFVLTNSLKAKNSISFSLGKGKDDKLSLIQRLDIFVTLIAVLYSIATLANFWIADTAYSLGSNLGHAGEYIKAYSALHDAVDRASFEPTFKDELAGNDAILAASLTSQLGQDPKNASVAAQFAENLKKEAIFATNQVTNEHPNNVVFWKTKVRVFYTLSQIDPKYLPQAISAIKKARDLAPTDAGIYYNLGLLYGQNGQNKEAVDALKKAIELKPNYINAYYGLGLFYRQLATNEKGQVKDEALAQKAIEEMQIILKMDPNNQDAKGALDLWTK